MEVSKWVQKIILPISTETFYVPFSKYYGDNIFDFGNLTAMKNRGGGLAFSEILK